MSRPAPTTTNDDDTEEFTPVEEIIDEHRDVFETIARHAQDPEFREKYGARALRHLNETGGDQR